MLIAEEVDIIYLAMQYYWQVLAFVAALESKRITVSVRQTRGLDASAACGQLRNQHQKTPIIDQIVAEPQLMPV